MLTKIKPAYKRGQVKFRRATRGLGFSLLRLISFSSFDKKMSFSQLYSIFISKIRFIDSCPIIMLKSAVAVVAVLDWPDDDGGGGAGGDDGTQELKQRASVTLTQTHTRT